MRKTLKFRLSLIITALLALATLAGGAYIVRKASDDTRAEVRSAMNLADHFIDAEAAIMRDRSYVRGFSAPLFHLHELQDVRHLSVTFYGIDGRTLDSNADTDNPNPVAPDWFTRLVRLTSKPMEAHTRRIVFDDKPVGSLVIAPDPTYEVDEIWTTSRNLLELLLVFFLLINVLVWYAVSLAMRPIEEILAALSEIGRGNLAARLPAFGLPEMSRISVGFNHMAETLESSVSENQRLTRQMIEVQEEERKRLARELHDEIGQYVTAIHADAAVIRKRGGPQVLESAQAIITVTAGLKTLIRSMLQRLRPPVLEGLGLRAALQELTETFKQRHPEIECEFALSPLVSELEGEIAVALYRVMQESLTNIAAHSSARHVAIRVSPVANNRLQLTVADDGVGFFVVSPRRGYGLTGIRERVTALGGRCEIDSNPGRGTRLSVEVPLPAKMVHAA